MSLNRTVQGMPVNAFKTTKQLLQEQGLYNRHGQRAVIESISKCGNHADGYGVRYDGTCKRLHWYVCKSSDSMPYVAEADYPSGWDLLTEKPKEPYAAIVNGKHNPNGCEPW